MAGCGCRFPSLFQKGVTDREGNLFWGLGSKVEGLGVETIGICTVVIFLDVWASRFTRKGKVEN